ncbi:uncharacterized protein [Amphiura filiformis]|uniref:uncharacterized protein n=1 Tax=Amphiura filiformis TaxID=82378 RepID=UPI003B21D18A
MLDMASSYLENAEADLSCPLCLELFVDPNTPKQLDCPHVYCQKCLTEMVKGGMRVITCPECRMQTRVPRKTAASKDGVSALRTSIRLRSLAENHLKHPGKLNAYEQSTTETGHTKSRVPNCPIHVDDKLYFYCVTCNVLVCQACGLLDHDRNTHEIKDVKAFYTEKRQHMKDKIHRAYNKADKIEHLVQHVLQLQRRVTESAVVTEQEIDQAITAAYSKVHENGEALKAQLREATREQLLRYENQTEELKREKQVLRNKVAEVESVMESATAYDYVTKYDQLKETLERIQLVGKSTKKVDPVPQVTTSHKFVSEQVGSLGKLVLVREMKQMQALGNAYNAKHIGGGKGVLAVCQSKDVHIYHKQATDKYKHELNLNVENACDVAVTGNGKYMVVTPTSVEVFSPKGKHEGTFYEYSEDVRAIDYIMGREIRTVMSSIAVLLDGRVIVGDEGTKTLVVLTHDGTKVKTINLGCVPHSLAAMKGSQVALCDQRMGKVCVLDVDIGGEVLVDIPDVRCVCYDEVSDCLMIGSGLETTGWGEMAIRVTNSKIEQYCVSPWKFITSFDTGSDIPIAMTSSDRNHLVVGFKSETSDFDVDYIKIYKCIG